MNCNQANDINITDFLYSIGHTPKTIKGNNYWYILREEHTPSTKVDIGINKWFDYGENKGGKLVDLVCHYFTNGDTKKALSYIGEKEIWNREVTVINNIDVKIIKVADIQNKALLDYLNERHIYNHYQDVLKEIYYSIGDKKYFALCWLNDTKGYETRNKYFKGCLLNKGITTIEGTDNNKLDIWEGMFDYLSYRQKHSQRNKTIILNSVTNSNKAILGIESYKDVNLYLDNDKAGKKALEYFKTIRSDVKDCSDTYKGFKDFNEYLLHYESN